MVASFTLMPAGHIAGLRGAVADESLRRTTCGSGGAWNGSRTGHSGRRAHPCRRVAFTDRTDGSVCIGETAVALDEIAPKLKAIAKNGYDEQIFVRGDKGVAYGTVMRVMGRISAGGFRKVSLVTEVEDGG